MALTEIYVDPSIAANSGLGTLVSPYGDLAYAIATATQGTTGTRLNIKAGTDEILANDLETDLNTAVWSITEANPLVIQGYTAAAADGGVGGIDGNAGGFHILGATGSRRYVTFKDMHLHNTGAIAILDLDNYSSVFDCELDNCTSNAIESNIGCIIAHNYIHNVSGSAVTGPSSFIGFNYFENGANNFANTAGGGCINSPDTTIANNIFSLDGLSDGITAGDTSAIFNNSIYSNGGGGIGIYVGNTSSPTLIANNIIAGFSDTSAKAIGIGGTSSRVKMLVNNSWYNCFSGIETFSTEPVENSGNEELTASPFTDPGNGDFSPVDTGLVKEGSWPATFKTA